MPEYHTFITPSGPIRAPKSSGLIHAQGIPYAQAERFQKPSPIPPWTSSLDASTPSPACPQIKDEMAEAILRQPLLKGLSISESCHKLSITLPERAAHSSAQKGDDSSGSGDDAKLPVLVFIHGGAYVTGAGDALCYDASAIVREQKIIAVMVTYRVGLLGYIGDGSPSRPANLGLLDQIEALRWVQTNIGAFGGDSSNVTVAGQSAGGDAVIHLLAIEGAKTLFKRGIIQSAPLGIRGGRFKMSEALFKYTKDLTPETPIDQVIERTKQALASVKNYGLMAGMCIATQYKLDPLPAEDKLEEVWTKNMKDIDILIGSTRDEIAMFKDTIPGLNTLFAVPAIGLWLETILVRYFTKSVYEDELHRVARLLGKSGNVWLYDYFWKAPQNPYGSAHAIELMMEWGNKEVFAGSKFAEGAQWDDIDALGKQFRQLWAAFVRGEILQDRDEIKDVLSYHKIR